MVEALILMVLGIGGWAVYLWHTKGKEEAKAFVEKSADEIQKTNVGILKGLVGCAGICFLVVVALLVLGGSLGSC